MTRLSAHSSRDTSMKLLIPALAFMAMFVSACGSTEYIPRKTVTVRTFDLNITSLRGPARVDLLSKPAVLRGNHFNILGDSAMWLDAESKQPVVISLAD